MEEMIVRDEELVKKAEEMIEKQEFGERRLSGIPYTITFLIAIAASVPGYRKGMWNYEIMKNAKRIN